MRLLSRVLSLVLVVASIASAQPLIDHVPADAMVYVGWRGADELKVAYDKSHLAAVVSASHANEIFEQTIPQLIAKAGEDQPQALEIQKTLAPLLQKVWQRPTAFSFAPGVDSKGNFEPRIAILCDAGDEAAAFHQDLSAAIKPLEQDQLPLRTGIDGRLVALTLGYQNAADALKVASTLRAAAPFVNAMKQAGPDPAYAVYIDIERILGAIDAEMTRENIPAEQDRWRAARESFGLHGLKRFIMTGAFAGADWSSHLFLESPAPRKGMLSLLGQQPVRPSSLKLIPKTAAYAGVRQVDLGKILTQVQTAIKAVNPRANEDLDEEFTKASQRTGFDIRGAIDGLGDQWIMYADDSVGGVGFDGTVLINELDDAAKVQNALTRLTQIASMVLAQQQGNSPFRIQLGEQKIGDLSVQYLQIPQVTPSWVVADRRLIFAFKPETVAAAVGRAANPPANQSIVENEQFQALRKHLAGASGKATLDAMTSFEFADLPQSAPSSYARIQSGIALLGMLGASQGVWVPPNLLPSMDQLKPHLAPSAAVNWVDAAGWHSRSVSPFPGSQVFAAQQVDTVAVGGTALGVSILLPSLNRARETANRVKCASNMRQIGQAILLCSNDNRGRYPAALGELIKTQDITIEVFTCPSGSITPPADISATNLAKLAQWLDAGNSPYTYVGKGFNNTAGPEVLVLYERDDDHDGDGMNMLFGDGHVEWVPMAQAKKLIAAAK